MRVQNTSQIEDLVSHGYIVAALDHTYGAIFTVFPDGRVALQNRDALPSDVPDDEYERAAELLVNVWTADLKYLLDSVADMHAGIIDSPLTGAVDLSHVGVFGHSTGGGTTVEFCALDDRCTAALGMDTWLLPVSDDVIEAGIPQPFMFMHSEGWTQDEHWDQFMEFYPNLPGAVYSFAIEGTRHYDFTDIPLLSALAPALDLKGPLDGERVVTIVNAYTLAFFNQTLKGNSEPLLSGTNQEFPEVDFEFRVP
jgi:predicted dienelactone hydrolase